ncbi:hypothetical protein CYMTET_47440 [Cymbomonas tetramitiformis]|uniref:Photosynthesis system II assembly factor Ycf48/Hcf136-like domain-containing protein n=1 Tax=Cymbomonas tetramitiformis TaxID=36881 RepID=A0AAE0EWN6_9CHLO|nr:hypothetical protein CYMTET_47440 [Cymbomonas tetramitiformis]
MRRVVAVALILSALPRGAAQSWVSLDSPTSNRLTGVHFPNSTHGWAVGAYNTLIHTTNAGASWSSQQPPGVLGSQEWRSVSFADTQVGWVVGDEGHIIMSRNGGVTWQSQQSGVTDALYAVQALELHTVWAVGANGAIIRSTDGGETWISTSPDPPVTTSLYDVAFLNSSVGYVTGEYGAVLRTLDGGASWVQQVTGSAQALRGMDMVQVGDQQVGWIVGDGGTMLHTDSSGDIWQPRSGCGSDFDLYSVRLGAAQDGGDPEHVFMVGTAHNGVCFTTDGGEVFTVEAQVDTKGRALLSLGWTREAESELVAVGHDGHILGYRCEGTGDCSLEILLSTASSTCAQASLGSPHRPAPTSIPTTFTATPSPKPPHALRLPTLLPIPFRRRPLPPPPPPTATWCVEFDGLSQYLRINTVSEYIGVSVWVNVHLEQRSAAPQYLLDARYSSPESFLGTPPSVAGQNWRFMYVDGKNVTDTMSWESIPIGQWAFVHLEAVEAITESMLFMARVQIGYSTETGTVTVDSYGGFLRGRLGEVYYWGDYLTEDQASVVSKGFNRDTPSYLLRAYYALEEGVGDLVFAFLQQCERDVLGGVDCGYSHGNLVGEPGWVTDAAHFAGWHMKSIIPPPPSPPPVPPSPPPVPPSPPSPPSPPPRAPYPPPPPSRHRPQAPQPTTTLSPTKSNTTSSTAFSTLATTSTITSAFPTAAPVPTPPPPYTPPHPLFPPPSPPDHHLLHPPTPLHLPLHRLPTLTSTSSPPPPLTPLHLQVPPPPVPLLPTHSLSPGWAS